MLIGGVLVGTAITLLFVPALYALIMRPEKQASERQASQQQANSGG